MAYLETDSNVNLGGGDGFGSGMWVIVLFALIFGWGRGGYGGGGVQDGYVLASDFANIERKIDGVNNGLCDGFYAMNTSLLNGFSGVNMAIQEVNYNQAKNTCEIIQAGHNDTQRIVDILTAQTIEAKNEKIAEKQAEIDALRLRASQEAQNNYLISQLKGNCNCNYNCGL